MEKRPVMRTIRVQPPPPEDSIRLMEVSEVISLFTGKGLGKQGPIKSEPEFLPEYA